MINEVPERDPLPEKSPGISLSRLAIILTLVFVTLSVILLCSRGLDWAASILWPNPNLTDLHVKSNSIGPATQANSNVNAGANSDHSSTNSVTVTSTSIPQMNPIPLKAPTQLSPIASQASELQNDLPSSSSQMTVPIAIPTNASDAQQKPSTNNIDPIMESTNTSISNVNVEKILSPTFPEQSPEEPPSSNQSKLEKEIIGGPTKQPKPAISTTASNASQIKSGKTPTVTAGKKKVGLTKSEKEILKVNKNHYAIQILALHDKKNLELFVARSNLKGKARYYCGKFQSKPWYILIYGNYSSIQDAKKALAGLPENLKKHKPWIRSYAFFQESICAR